LAIGVFDSGLGGLTVLDRLQAVLPDQAFVYLGDNKNAPYGPRSPSEILDLTIAASDALFRQGCNLVILACNTASAVALRLMQEVWVPADRRVLGVLVPMIEDVVGQSWEQTSRPLVDRKVLFFGTPATVASGAFTRETRLRARGVQIAEVACPGLVDALEAGDSAMADALVEQFSTQGRAQLPGADVAVLGCTHYPLKQAGFAAAFPEAAILHQGDIVARSLRSYLTRHTRFAGQGPTRYLTTGDRVEVTAAAARFLGRDLDFKHL